MPGPWLFYLAGGVAAVGGLALLLWSLLWDRSRGRRRCPKCWYDMSGVPAADGAERFVCPECGREATRLKRLHRTRRRWRWAFVSFAALVVGLATTMIPPVHRSGWMGIIPTSILVYIAPPETASRQLFLSATYPGVFPQPTPTRTFDERLRDEAWTRLGAGQMWTWQSQAYIDRCLRKSCSPPLIRVEWSPAQWVRGCPMPVQLSDAALQQVAWPLFIQLAVPDGPETRTLTLDGRKFGRKALALEHLAASGPDVAARIEFLAGTRVVARRDAPFTVAPAWADDPADLLPTFQGPVIDASALAIINPRVYEPGDGSLTLRIGNRSADPPWDRPRAIIAFDAELSLDGTVVATLSEWLEWNTHKSQPWEEPFTWKPGGRERAYERGRVTLTLRGNPRLAGEVYMRYLRGDSCWAGSVSVEVDLPKPAAGPD